MAVGLDTAFEVGENQSDEAIEARSALYRALTRAQMMVVVVNKFLPGGWLEWLAHLRFDGKHGKIDVSAEQARRDEAATRTMISEIKAVQQTPATTGSKTDTTDQTDQMSINLLLDGAASPELKAEVDRCLTLMLAQSNSKANEGDKRSLRIRAKALIRNGEASSPEEAVRVALAGWQAAPKLVVTSQCIWDVQVTAEMPETAVPQFMPVKLQSEATKAPPADSSSRAPDMEKVVESTTVFDMNKIDNIINKLGLPSTRSQAPRSISSRTR